jgi:amidase
MNEFIRQFSLIHADADAGNAPTIVIKDTIDIAGMPTTAGSRALSGTPAADRHADVVEQVLAAGWCIVGKANMHELAFGMTGINDFTGTPQNPQDTTRIPGGSSSGSAAAVGLHLADAALGTDTGGSIRGPAACCGVLGLKPTFGRVSRRGVAPSLSSLDCVGPFARDMLTLINVMAAIAPGFDIAATHASPFQFKVGIARVEAMPEILDAVTHAVSLSGFTSQEVKLAHMGAAFDAGLSVINAETWRAFGHLAASDLLGADLRKRLQAASLTGVEQLDAAEAVRVEFTAEVDRALERVDAIVMPTMPAFPITLDAARSGTSVIAMSSLIRPFNLSGHPALSLPLPVAGSPLKAGLQIIGRKGADEIVCALAAQVERALHQ